MWKLRLCYKKVNLQVTERSINMAMIARPQFKGDVQTMKFNTNQISTGGGRGPNHTAGHLKPKNKKTPFSKGGGKGPG